ncbi:CD63 antigen-like isoform X1 [Octopus sinensis]|uniref:CD63 antigen-like isoform X1 n=1 Tax=Octopus sinensis TaxID=2607531 RepID=A0A7E6EV64_9MOLL|nr:CD63 antigen-like isoform X1 [Octopus sinensis]
MADEQNQNAEQKPRRRKKAKKQKIISSTGTTIFMIINVFLVIIGGTLILGGIIVKYGSAKMEVQLQPLYKTMAEAISEADMPDFGRYVDITHKVALGFIVTGSCLLFIALIGCCGGCCQNRTLLILYGFLLTCVMVTETGFVILLFSVKKEMKDSMKEPMIANLKNMYAGPDQEDVTSYGWNFVMSTFQCCGISNYTEFHHAKKWDRRTKIRGMQYLKIIPDTCCSRRVDILSEKRFKEMTDTNCTINPTLSNSYIGKSCWNTIQSLLNEQSGLMMGIGVTVLGFEILVFVISLIEANAGTFTKEKKALKCRRGSWNSLKKYGSDGCGKYLPVQRYPKGSKKVNHGLETLL